MPPAVAELTVVQALPVAWAAHCSVHGPLPMLWSNPVGAAMDALGHAAHHHRSPDRATLP